MQNEKNKLIMNELSTLLAQVDDASLINDFLTSLLTPNEVSGISSRWALVKLLEEGVSQRAIASDLGVSLCKITRGSKELKKENSPLRTFLDILKED